MQHLLKVSLRDVRPYVTREFVVPSAIRLDRLHEVLQLVMGWSDAHLHEFIVGGLRRGLRFGPPDSDAEAYGRPPIDERNVSLVEIAGLAGAKFFYQYDFGDDWLHDVVVKDIGELEPTLPVPRCLKATGVCPPENCGGASGYESLLAARRDPEHAGRADPREWFDGSFDPDAAYDLDGVNASLARLVGGGSGKRPAPTVHAASGPRGATTKGGAPVARARRRGRRT
jgi:hypothetical protein